MLCAGVGLNELATFFYALSLTAQLQTNCKCGKSERGGEREGKEVEMEGRRGRKKVKKRGREAEIMICKLTAHDILHLGIIS